jgi:ribosomal protein S1
VPPPAVNEPLAFINFVAAFPVGSMVDGEVVSFTSHGAMVDVTLPEGGRLHCYIPLSAMGTPPPIKARHVLHKGEVRSFALAGLDPPRRVAELALPLPAPKKRRPPTKKAAQTAS